MDHSKILFIKKAKMPESEDLGVFFFLCYCCRFYKIIIPIFVSENVFQNRFIKKENKFQKNNLFKTSVFGKAFLLFQFKNAEYLKLREKENKCE